MATALKPTQLPPLPHCATAMHRTAAAPYADAPPISSRSRSHCIPCSPSAAALYTTPAFIHGHHWRQPPTLTHNPTT